MRYEIGDSNTSINKSLTQFAHWANKEQTAKRKEQLILRFVIPAKAGIHCVADIFCSPCGAIDTRLRGYDVFIFFS